MVFIMDKDGKAVASAIIRPADPAAIYAKDESLTTEYASPGVGKSATTGAELGSPLTSITRRPEPDGKFELLISR
jgi:hypothetical protein